MVKATHVVQVEFPDDVIVDRALKKITKRATDGLKKYGCSMWDAKMTLRESLLMAQEEAMDTVIYLEKAISRLDGDAIASAVMTCPCPDCVRRAALRRTDRTQ